MNKPPSPKIDVALSAYGKPYQTAVSILSLLKYSHQWIDTIYLTIERQQPYGAKFDVLRSLLEPYNVVCQQPAYHVPYLDQTRGWRSALLRYKPYRQSIRYQYAWERSNKQFLLVMHNDMLYHGDLVGAYLERIGDSAGIGKVGQCWNCPAHKAGKCWSDVYATYQPDYKEVSHLYHEYGSVRGVPFSVSVHPGQAWPLPECRLNEFTALIKLDVVRPVTMPMGPAFPLGTFGPVDTGVKWFQQINHLGLRVAHMDFEPYATHGWTNGLNSGHRALSDRAIYEQEEQQAYELLRTEWQALTGPLADYTG